MDISDDSVRPGLLAGLRTSHRAALLGVGVHGARRPASGHPAIPPGPRGAVGRRGAPHPRGPLWAPLVALNRRPKALSTRRWGTGLGQEAIWAEGSSDRLLGRPRPRLGGLYELPAPDCDPFRRMMAHPPVVCFCAAGPARGRDRASPRKFGPKLALNRETLGRKSQKIPVPHPRLASPIKVGLALS
jgi:hypothetical protein